MPHLFDVACPEVTHCRGRTPRGLSHSSRTFGDRTDSRSHLSSGFGRGYPEGGSGRNGGRRLGEGSKAQRRAKTTGDGLRVAGGLRRPPTIGGGPHRYGAGDPPGDGNLESVRAPMARDDARTSRRFTSSHRSGRRESGRIPKPVAADRSRARDNGASSRVFRRAVRSFGFSPGGRKPTSARPQGEWRERHSPAPGCRRGRRRHRDGL